MKVYTLIYNRFVACQMSAAVFAVTTVEVTAGKGLFRATGRIEKFDGYRRVMAPAKSEDVLLPPVKEKPDARPARPVRHPALHPTAAAVQRGEPGEGDGEGGHRPAEHLQQHARSDPGPRVRRAAGPPVLPDRRGQDGSRTCSTAHFPTVMDLKFTRHFEEELDGIQTGEHSFEGVLNEFWKPFHELLVPKPTLTCRRRRASRSARRARSAGGRCWPCSAARRATSSSGAAGGRTRRTRARTSGARTARRAWGRR